MAGRMNAASILPDLDSPGSAWLVLVTCAIFLAVVLLARLFSSLRVKLRPSAAVTFAVRLLHPRSLWPRAVPGDGVPLTDDELHAFVDIIRGYRVSAPDPHSTRTAGGHP
jgi:hypothetical protein